MQMGILEESEMLRRIYSNNPRNIITLEIFMVVHGKI